MACGKAGCLKSSSHYYVMNSGHSKYIIERCDDHIPPADEVAKFSIKEISEDNYIILLHMNA